MIKKEARMRRLLGIVLFLIISVLAGWVIYCPASPVDSYWGRGLVACGWLASPVFIGVFFFSQRKRST